MVSKLRKRLAFEMHKNLYKFSDIFTGCYTTTN